MEIRPYYLLSSVILSCGIVIAGYFISQGVESAKSSSRYVTVKGLAEREVVADLAVWPITIKMVGDDLALLTNQTEINIGVTKKFLLEQGFTQEEFALNNYVVNDLLANPHRNASTENARYIIQATILLKTPNVKLVETAASMQYLLAQKGIVFGARNDYEQAGPLYILSKFSDIKPAMLSEAIANAREAAKQFAIDSKSKVGKIRTANQGSFTITPADGFDLDYGDNQDKKTIQKKIRVVTTLEYILE